jgi:hypothetical protein
MDVLRHVVKAEGGVTAVFKGLWPTLIREVPGNAIMFGVYELLKQKLAAAKVRTPCCPHRERERERERERARGNGGERKEE